MYAQKVRQGGGEGAQFEGVYILLFCLDTVTN